MKIAAALFIAVAAFGQPQQRNITLPDEPSANLPAQKINANDLISVSVYNAPELSRSIRVGPDGSIRLPMLKEPLKIDGLMPVEVEIAIATALKHEQILVDPAVTVTVSEYHSRPISVMGAVKNPITFQADSTITLLDALARAEGLAQDAGPEILVSKKQLDDTPLVQRIPVKGLLDLADAEQNIKLTGGENILVPTASKIFVVGNVKTPGAFPVQDAQEISLMQALALAGGLAPLSNKQAFIYRRDTTGNKNEIPVELSKIMNRKAPDAQLLPNDILYVPDASGKRATFSALEKILMYGSGATSAMIYAGVR